LSVSGYHSKERLLIALAEGKNVLHLGAVGCTLGSIEEKIAYARRSIHGLLTRISTCVGIDIDGVAVKALSEAGIFDNLVAADVQAVTRREIPLERIDIVVAGDIIEHLSNPGLMLDSVARLSDPATVLVVTTPNAMGLPNFSRYAFHRWVDGPDHVCTFNEFTLRNLLSRHGWRVTTLNTCYQPRARQRNSPQIFWLGQQVLRRIPQLGGTLFAVAEKAD
jgi:2-polyprenyl-3-methyl-5-hydroxy-6-metoxy-1,4-benzoquinol methylase